MSAAEAVASIQAGAVIATESWACRLLHKRLETGLCPAEPFAASGESGGCVQPGSPELRCLFCKRCFRKIN